MWCTKTCEYNSCAQSRISNICKNIMDHNIWLLQSTYYIECQERLTLSQTDLYKTESCAGGETIINLNSSTHFQLQPF